MPQQKGFKRAIKVAQRAQKKKLQAREASFRRYERAVEAFAAASAATDKK